MENSNASISNIAKAFGASHGDIRDGKNQTIEWDNARKTVYVFKKCKIRKDRKMNKALNEDSHSVTPFTLQYQQPHLIMTNEGQIESQNESIYEPQKKNLKKCWKMMFYTIKENSYQDVPEYQEIQVKQISLKVIL